MRFDGRVWFDFTNPAVWQFYQFARALAENDNSVNLEWIPLYQGAETDAMATFVSLPSPQDKGRFLHAMLGLVHIERLDGRDASTVGTALEAAGIGPPDRSDIDVLETLAAAASELGVSETPTLYNGGPVMHVVLNAAARSAAVDATAEMILSVLANDGVWSLTKP